MLGLLRTYIERLNSLKHFYNLQKESINKVAECGKKKNLLGYLVEYYLNTISFGSEEEKNRQEFKKVEEVVNSHIEIIRSGIEENTFADILYKIKDKKFLEEKGIESNFERSATKYRQYNDMPIIHGSNTLVMLIIRFEEFIASFIEILYRKYPEKYLDAQEITFSEIEHLGVEEIKNRIVNRQIDAIMRESYEEWFKTFSSHKINLDAVTEEINRLKEIYARRNIFVHNSGTVNEIYIKNTKSTEFKIGDRLKIDEKYLNEAFDTIEIIIFSIIIGAIKINKGNQKECVKEIFDTAFNELVEKKYAVCYKVFGMLCKVQEIDNQYRFMSQVNCWIAAKEIYGLENIKDELLKFDVSALNDDFCLAKLILLEEYVEATKMLKSFGEKEQYLSMVEEWPLFSRYKETEEYKNFKAKYPDMVGSVSIETDTEAKQIEINDEIIEENKIRL